MSHIPTVLINSGKRYKEQEFPIFLQSYIRRGGDYDGDGDGDPDPYVGQIRVWQWGVGGVDHGRMAGVGLFRGEDGDGEEDEEMEDVRGDLEQVRHFSDEDREMGR